MWLAGNAGVWSSVECGLQAMLGCGVVGVWLAGNAGVWSSVESGLQAMLGCGVVWSVACRQCWGVE